MNQGNIDQYLYLFSSSIRDLYAIDTLNTIALPREWIIHYRYHFNYVDKVLWGILPQRLADAQQSVNQLKGRPIVLSYNHQEPDPSDGTKYIVKDLYPLRLGRIVRAFKDGQVAHFFVSLQDTLQYNPKSGADLHQRALQNALQNKTPIQGTHAALGGEYEIKAANEGDDTKAFQSLVEVIAGQGFGKNTTIFAKFHNLIEINPGDPSKSDNTLPIKTDILPNQSGYMVVDDKSYAISVSTFHSEFLNRPYLKDASLEIVFDPTRFVALGGTRIPISGRYDFFSFPLSVVRQSRNTWTSITIRAIPGITRKDADAGGQAILAEFRGPEWIIPVQIEVNQRRRAINRLLNALAEITVAGGTVWAASLRSLNVTEPFWYVVAAGVILLGVAAKVMIPPRE